VSRQNDKEFGKDQNKEKLVDPQRSKRAKSPLKKPENIQVSKRSSSAGRSYENSKQREAKPSSTKVRERTFKKQDMLFDSNTNSENVKKKVSKSEMRKASVVKDAMSKGGLLAPTQSWLLHIGDKKEMKSRSPSPGPKEVKRSISVPRKLIDRSPSPKRRMQFITKDADKNLKEHQPVQASPRTQRRSLSVRASPDPNVNLKRSGSIKRVQNIEKQNTISKSSSNKSTNGKRSTEHMKAKTNKDMKTIKHHRKSQSDIEENSEIKNLVSEQTANTSITKDENENEKEINTMTATDESSSATSFQSETTTTLNQSSVQSSCVEETSITATEVIEMFESESKTESKETNIKLTDKMTKTKTNAIKTDVKKSGVQANTTKGETIQSSEKAKSSNKSSTSKLANGSSNQMTKTNGLSNAAVTNVKNSLVKNVTTNSDSTKSRTATASNRKTKSTELSEQKTSEMATKISETSSTKTKKSTCEESFKEIGMAKKEEEPKPRTTMIIRLHPGNSKRVSAYLEHQACMISYNL